MTKTIEGKPVYYLVEAPDGDVDLGPVQRTPLTANVDLENKVRAFELTVGQYAYTSSGEAKGAASALAERAVSVVESFFVALNGAQIKIKEVDQTLGTVLGSPDATYAGSVGQDVEAVKKAKGGDLREQMTIASNLAFNLGAAYLEGTKVADMTKFHKSISETSKDLSDRLKVMTDKDNALIPNTGEASPIDKQFTEQQDIRDQKKRPPRGTSQAQKTIGDLRAELRMENPLSEAEPETMARTAGVPVETLKSYTKEQLEAFRLTWSEGIRTQFINEESEFVKKLRDAAVPLGAGTSGTTARIVSAAKLLGFTDAIGLRAAAIAYIVPIRAHTLWEVMRGAVAGGAPAVAEDLSAFLKIDPFPDSETVVYPDPEFWQAVKDHLSKK